jgi:hypothetical protein
MASQKLGSGRHLTGDFVSQCFFILSSFLPVSAWLVPSPRVFRLLTKYGSGQHIWDILQIPREYIIPTLQIRFKSLLVYHITLALTQLSICLFYLRHFDDKTTKYIVYTTIGFISVPTVIVSGF